MTGRSAAAIGFEPPYPAGWFASVVTERDAIARLPTWPWDTMTMTAFVTTMVLPVIVWVLQRVLTRSGF